MVDIIGRVHRIILLFVSYNSIIFKVKFTWCEIYYFINIKYNLIILLYLHNNLIKLSTIFCNKL